MLKWLNFKGLRESVDNLYNESKIDRLKSIIIKANGPLVYNQVTSNLAETVSYFFTLNTQLQRRNTRKNSLTLPNVMVLVLLHWKQ